MHESAVLTSVLKYLGNRSDVRCWRNNTGRIADRNGRVVSFGLVGSADVIGMRKTWIGGQGGDGTWGALSVSVGQFLAVECKSSTGRQSEAQRNFQKMVESMGGLYLLVRDVADLYPWFPKE